MEETRVPVYLITGFLESGKTSFLSFTLQQDYFQIDGKTLLILCEEGEEEYDEEALKQCNTVVESIDSEEELTPERLAAMEILHQPERVIIEYNGMWLVSKFEEMEKPEGWGVEQHITCVDASTFQVYTLSTKKQTSVFFSVVCFFIISSLFFCTKRAFSFCFMICAHIMNIQELQWVKRENIPVKMIVMNNEALGMIRHLQRDYFDCVYADTSDGSGFSSCDFTDVAQAYGIPAKRIQGEDVEKYAGGFLEQNGPELLEIMLEHGTYAYPKTCLGEPIHNQQPYIPKPIFDELMEL